MGALHVLCWLLSSLPWGRGEPRPASVPRFPDSEPPSSPWQSPESAHSPDRGLWTPLSSWGRKKGFCLPPAVLSPPLLGMHLANAGFLASLGVGLGAGGESPRDAPRTLDQGTLSVPARRPCGGAEGPLAPVNEPAYH